MEQQNKYRVIASARAAQMLVSHAAFLAQVSPAAAELLTVEFEKAAKSLEQMPQRCPWLKGEYIPKNAYRFILFEKRYMLIQRNHTFTLSDDEGTIKTEQIQPLWGTVKVSGDCDTDVVFTDVETGEKYKIGYITQGVTERIKLERGKWYKVVGRGNLTLNPVNIRVE